MAWLAYATASFQFTQELDASMASSTAGGTKGSGGSTTEEPSKAEADRGYPEEHLQSSAAARQLPEEVAQVGEMLLPVNAFA